MPPHWLHAGPRSRPARRAGTTGGVSVKATVGGCAGGGGGAAAPGAGAGAGRGGRRRLRVGGSGRAVGRPGRVTVAVAAVAVRRPRGVGDERGRGRLGRL